MFAACLLTIASGCKKELKPTIEDSSDNAVAASRPAGPAYMPNELLVKFKPNTSELSRGQSLEHIKGSVKERILTKTMERFGDNQGLFLIHTPLDVLEATAALRNLGEIEYAEPNYIYTYDATSNDTYFTNGSLWGMYGVGTSPSNQYGCQAAAAWNNGNVGSSNVIVGIIDEGVMNSHADLAANCWVNPYDPIDGVDNDGNGYVDDKWGWDFVGNNNSTFDGTNDDHGTHVAGTIGAVGGNGSGVAGVCWNVKMISCKFLGNNGGTTGNAVKAIDYVTDLKTRHGLNIVATNNSWGGGGYNKSLEDAIGRANNADILFIAAAGNNSSNNDAAASYPSNYNKPNVIAVASITSTGALSSFSNYGATKVHLGAPGSAIYSTLPGKGKNSSTYGSYSGTSMATPHVTGAAALYASSHPGASAASIKSAILNTVTPTGSLNGKCSTGGRLNVSGF